MQKILVFILCAGLWVAEWTGTAQAVTITTYAKAHVAAAGTVPDEDGQSDSTQARAWAEQWAGTPSWECEGLFCGDWEAALAAAYGDASGNVQVGAGHVLGSGYTGLPADGYAFASVTWSEPEWVVPESGSSFTFTVNQGSLNVGGSAEGSGTLTASYLIEIWVGQVLKWTSSATLTAEYQYDSGGNPLGWVWSYDDSHDLLGGTVLDQGTPTHADIGVTFAEQTHSLDLSPWAGTTVPITYYMEVYASDPTEIGLGNWSAAQFGDPFQPVPEPSTLLLFGAGLAGLGGARRRAKK
ncbi:MAG: PEP-CTERM sorting domain-containing protein [Deltaproteobacteria bacterium]|nr:PEP-CTERM sorting domain-containing protein [Deltaproteobacteria bacterium]